MSQTEIEQAISDGVAQGLSHKVASQVINALWGYNVKEIFIWQVSPNGSGVAYTVLKNGKSFDSKFNKFGIVGKQKIVTEK